MKAKEYAQKYIDNPTDETLYEIAKEMFFEIDIIRKARNAQSNEAMIAIINEQSDKWRKFANIVKNVSINIVKEDGFKNFVLISLPELKNNLK
ncbi:MAG: hypothetical protein WC414_04290 [Patescibacteria group bacterium]